MIGKSYDGTLVQRRRRDGRRGPQDDRAGLARSPPGTSTRAPAASATTPTTRRGLNRNITTPAAPTTRPASRSRAAARSARRSTTTSPTTPTSTPATVTRTATSTRSGTTATTSRTPPRSRPPSSPRTASRTTTSAWTTIGMWWHALKANGVKPKLWLLRAGHTDPFESRRAVWVDTLHRWFDHYLYGVNNGIENEPARHDRGREGRLEGLHELADPRHAERRRLPARRPTTPRAGTLGGIVRRRGRHAGLHRHGDLPNETTLMNTPTGSQANRRVFLSRPLTKDVRALRHRPSIDLVAVARHARRRTSARCSSTTAPARRSRAAARASPTPPTRTCWGDTQRPAAPGLHHRRAPARRRCARSTPPATSRSPSRRRTSRSGASRAARWTRRTATRCGTPDATPLHARTRRRASRSRRSRPSTSSRPVTRSAIVIVGNLFGANASRHAATSATHRSADHDRHRSSRRSSCRSRAATAPSPRPAAPTPRRSRRCSAPCRPTSRVTTADADRHDGHLHAADRDRQRGPEPDRDLRPGLGLEVRDRHTTVVTCTAKDANGNTSRRRRSTSSSAATSAPSAARSPATLALTLGAPVQFGAFTPGVAKDVHGGAPPPP